MSDLIVIAYHDVNQAGRVLDSLKRMMTEKLIDLEDAVYVTKDNDGKVELHQTINMPGIGAAAGGARGALWGTLIGLLFLQPLAGAAIGAAVGAGTGAIAGKMTDIGIDDNFVRQLSAEMTPNSSALFLLVRRVTADKVVPEISKFGGKVMRTSLSNEAEQRLQAALAQQTMAMPAPGTTDTAANTNTSPQA